MANRTLNNLFSPTFVIVHITLAFGLGIILARPALPSFPALLSATLCLGITGLSLQRLSPKKGHIVIVLFFLLVGFSHGSNALTPPLPRHHIANLVTKQTEVSLIGVVDKAVQYGIDKTTVEVECQRIFIPPAGDLTVPPDGHRLASFQKTTGLVKISMRGQPADSLLPGDHILTRVKIGPPQGFNNQGGFDLSLFLASQDIFISGWISSSQNLIPIDGLPGHQDRLRHRAERLRAHLINFLRQHLPEKHSSLYRALITGDRAGLTPETLELFRSLGIVHLLAISGIHMALLAAAVMATTYWLWQRSETLLLSTSARKASACAAIIPLILYCLVAGLQTPALRALVMILVFISALLSDRPWHGPTNVSLAALLILIVNPLAITTVSFQLSFAAVTGIIIILPHVRHLFTSDGQPGLQRLAIQYLGGSLAVSLAASLATLPLLLYHFNRFAVSGPLATIVTEPFLCLWGLGWGLTASLLSPIAPSLALLLFKTGGLGLDASLLAADKLQFLAKSIWLPTPTKGQIILFYGALFLFIKTPNLWHRLPAALCCLLIFIPLRANLAADQATILDVGQGNCTLIETTNGEVLIVDAGGPRSPTLDIGRQVIAPALWSKGIKSIDLLVLSHSDQDHYSGAAFILEHFRPKTLWLPTTDAKDPGWQKILAIAKQQQTAIHIPKEGETYPLGAGRQLSCLAALHLSHQEKQNNQSLVIKYTSANHSLLMPGDIEWEGEKALIGSSYQQLDSDIIIAPHHGSASSSSLGFLSRVAPQTVIFSASRYKKNHFPNPEVEARYQTLGASALHTSKHGAIAIFFHKEGLKTMTRK